jgi:hypothetical protein
MQAAPARAKQPTALLADPAPAASLISIWR